MGQIFWEVVSGFWETIRNSEAATRESLLSRKEGINYFDISIEVEEEKLFMMEVQEMERLSKLELN
jgi:hypothetical protein